MEGNVLRDIFTDSFLLNNPVDIQVQEAPSREGP